jgi:hypothetical protein
VRRNFHAYVRARAKISRSFVPARRDPTSNLYRSFVNFPVLIVATFKSSISLSFAAQSRRFGRIACHVFHVRESFILATSTGVQDPFGVTARVFYCCATKPKATMPYIRASRPSCEHVRVDSMDLRSRIMDALAATKGPRSQ